MRSQGFMHSDLSRIVFICFAMHKFYNNFTICNAKC